ncbi:MAG: 6-phosphogluconolactonase [Anaerolineae bacterium]
MIDRPRPRRTFSIDTLRIEVYADRTAPERAAARDIVEYTRHLLQEQERVRMAFTAAPSQSEMLAALADAPDLDWGRIETLHTDEYVGLPENAPQRLGRFLRERLFDRVLPARVIYIDGAADDPVAECARYAALLAERPIDILCIGIGENGRMGFNAPHVADFEDPQAVQVVELGEGYRHQQAHDGAFATVDEVPTHAITLTMPTLLAARRICCLVSGATRADIVRRTLYDAVDEACPATALRRHKQAMLYIDDQAAAHLRALP